MDFGAIMRFKQSWDTFCGNHPKFPGFVNAVKAKGIHEGDIIGVSIKDAEGKTIETNIRVTASDIELFNTLLKQN